MQQRIDLRVDLDIFGIVENLGSKTRERIQSNRNENGSRLDLNCWHRFGREPRFRFWCDVEASL